MKHTFHLASIYLWALTKSNRDNWLKCINLFASSTAINLFLKVYRILQRHWKRITSSYSTNFFTTFRTKFFSSSLRKVFFLTVNSTVLKSSKSLFQIKVLLGKIVSLVKLILPILTINMQSVFTVILVAKTWETITTCI